MFDRRPQKLPTQATIANSAQRLSLWLCPRGFRRLLHRDPATGDPPAISQFKPIRIPIGRHDLSGYLRVIVDDPQHLRLRIWAFTHIEGCPARADFYGLYRGCRATRFIRTTAGSRGL